MYRIINFIISLFFYRECTRLCEGIGLRAHTFTKFNKDKEKFNPKLAQKFGKNYIEYNNKLINNYSIYILIYPMSIFHISQIKSNNILSILKFVILNHLALEFCS
jgi:hypothetical protein